MLDLGRLEKGAFSSVSRPFSFHNVMRSIIVPLQLDATKRGLHLETYLDPRIDEVAKKASSGGLADDLIVQEGDGVVAGDEMRLRQSWSSDVLLSKVSLTHIYSSHQQFSIQCRKIHSDRRCHHRADHSGASNIYRRSCFATKYPTTCRWVWGRPYRLIDNSTRTP